MATIITYNRALDMRSGSLSSISSGHVETTTSSQFFVRGQFSRYEINGFGFVFDAASIPQAGTITSILSRYHEDNTAYVSYSGLSVSAQAFYAAGGTSSLDDDQALWDEMFGGNDTLRGGAWGDFLTGYGGDDQIRGNAGDDWLMGGAGGDRLDGGAGVDGVSYYDATSSVRVDLDASARNTGDAFGDRYVSIEKIEGSSFGDALSGNSAHNFIWGIGGNDILVGKTGHDWLIGGAGGDRLDGGIGSDGASYFGSARGVTANLLNPRLNRGEAAGDRYVSIEKVEGSRFADNLTGNRFDNFIFGRDGNDRIDGGNGHDWLTGDAGADFLIGGLGTDGASYYYAPAKVTANLSNAALNRGDARGDRYTSIEKLEGTGFDDTLVGNGAANFIWGVDGSDSITGGEGLDRLYGGAGADRFIFTTPDDSKAYLASRDVIFDFSETTGDRIVLSAIDADITKPGNQAFRFIGSGSFTVNKPGDLRYLQRGDDALIQADVNGDKMADFSVLLDGVKKANASFFVL